MPALRDDFGCPADGEGDLRRRGWAGHTRRGACSAVRHPRALRVRYRWPTRACLRALDPGVASYARAMATKPLATACHTKWSVNTTRSWWQQESQLGAAVCVRADGFNMQNGSFESGRELGNMKYEPKIVVVFDGPPAQRGPRAPFAAAPGTGGGSWPVPRWEHNVRC